MSESTNATAPLELVDGVNILEHQCQELRKLNSALARDHGELHARFIALAADFKVLAAEYEDLYAEYDTLVEDHEALDTRHEVLATKHQRLRALHAPSTTLLGQQHPQLVSHAQLSTSRRGSPPSLLESLNATTRSVPATPLGISNSAVYILKSPGTPHTPETQALNGRLASVGENAVNAGDLQASLSRLPSGQYDGGSLTFNSIQSSGLDDTLQQQYGGGIDSVYGLNGLDGNGYNSYGFEAGGRGGANSTSTDLPARSNSGAGDGKRNGLHCGLKHKRGDMDWECTYLEDLQGEIPVLCKDQHGCRYLQKKLEEGHFVDLMTDPFGNYLCQKILEYSTDEQRNVICDSIAQDLVKISLNMHGTRAVQKMIDFCRRLLYRLNCRRGSNPPMRIKKLLRHKGLVLLHMISVAWSKPPHGAQQDLPYRHPQYYDNYQALLTSLDDRSLVLIPIPYPSRLRLYCHQRLFDHCMPCTNHMRSDETNGHRGDVSLTVEVCSGASSIFVNRASSSESLDLISSTLFSDVTSDSRLFRRVHRSGALDGIPGANSRGTFSLMRATRAIFLQERRRPRTHRPRPQARAKIAESPPLTRGPSPASLSAEVVGDGAKSLVGTVSTRRAELGVALFCTPTPRLNAKSLVGTASARREEFSTVLPCPPTPAPIPPSTGVPTSVSVNAAYPLSPPVEGTV
ncbi:hypothetical protein K438DRAFT_2000386 [Mycena galopus ATCC 62051]|nr:hypothetical protein K438DRAFT_2000386 [Mycena galopus ATCC 62051]